MRAASRAYLALRSLRVDPSDAQLIEAVKVQAFGLAAEGDRFDPYVVVTDGERQVLWTVYPTAVRDAEWKGFKATDPGVDQPSAFRDGQPLFFEVCDYDDGFDTFVGGFVV